MMGSLKFIQRSLSSNLYKHKARSLFNSLAEASTGSVNVLGTRAQRWTCTKQRQRYVASHWSSLRRVSTLTEDLSLNKQQDLKGYESCNNHGRNFTTSSNVLISRNGRISGKSPDYSVKPNKSGDEVDVFGNYQVAYGSKTTWELVRTLTVFFFCKFSAFTDNAVHLMSLCYKILGRRISNVLIGRTVYDQFVAGTTPHELAEVIARLRHGGVGPMLCTPIECDADGEPPQEEFFDESLEKILASLQLALRLNDPHPMFQYRFSALMSGDILKTVSKLCSETTHNQEVIEAIIAGMKGRPVNFSQLPGWSSFPDDKIDVFSRALRRLGKISEAMKPVDVIGLVDAEYTYLNPALRLLALAMMKDCNTEKAKLFFTYQGYLKATPSILGSDVAYAKDNGFCFGLKLVRGAYMVKERQLARQLGYEDPVHESFDKTTESYHSCLDLLLTNVMTSRPLSLRFFIASHNEDTVRYAMRRMAELGIRKDGGSVFFGQLYGMADHVSFTLGHDGYRIYKSIPYGSIADTLPYLSRRAQENKSILANARRERALVAKTLKSRLLFMN
ncbi:unnamed protein product [Lymnaea stagnalis]|uniref:Proline dehydrogenase n=1 Tax=Lymnaea stagnalis TaxID=6523 RepID=A0AAV2HQ17_LYMST